MTSQAQPAQGNGAYRLECLSLGVRGCGAYAVLAHELLQVQCGAADGGQLELLHLLPQAPPVQGRHVLQQVFLHTMILGFRLQR